jgi:uncharacterized membrane protein
MNVESNKTLGGIGAILMLVGYIPFAGSFTGIISFVGFILVLFALHGLAKIYNERGIFNNFVYSIIACIAGVAVAVSVAVVAVFTTVKDFLYQIFPSWNGNWSTLSGLTPNTTNIDMSYILSLVADLIVLLVVVWITAILVTFFMRKSLKTLSAKTNIGLFSTAGLLLLIGAFLTIVLIGFLLIWVAILLMAIAFFQIKPQSEQQYSTMTPPTQS